MKKPEFCDYADRFTSWMADRLGTEQAGFEHTWISRSHKTGVARGELWECHSLFDAYRNYRWPSQVKGRRVELFDETTEVLGRIRHQMIEAIALGDGALCRDAVEEILKWGFPTPAHRNKVAKYLRALSDDELPGYLQAVSDHFANIDDSAQPFDYNGHQLVTDSGTTKVHALLCDDFIIYDGRVGAALGLLVRRWAEDEVGYEGIPDVLRFAWGGALPAGPQARRYRNPNPPSQRGRAPFPVLTGHSAKTELNVFANWLLCHVLEIDAKKPREQRSDFAALPANTRLRALESALFMIGYSVNDIYFPTAEIAV